MSTVLHDTPLIERNLLREFETIETLEFDFEQS